jgi:hypothetical protein
MSLKSYLIQTWRIDGMRLSACQALDWKDKTLFRQFPAHCQICGWEWRPDRSEQFIDVFGRVGKSKETGWLVWQCEQLNIIKPTGHADDHIRQICNRHKDIQDRVIDNLTGCYVDLIDKDWLVEMIQNVKYWAGCTFRFTKAILLDAVYWIIHPVKMYRWWKIWHI